MASKQAYQKKLNYLYTKGKEFSINGIEYIGEYHYDDGSPMTGPFKGFHSSIKLDRYYPSSEIFVYDNITGLDYTRYKEPIYKTQLPTTSEYQKGWFYRYVAFRNNNPDSIIFEIDQNQYNAVGAQNGIDPGLYTCVPLKWKLSGTEKEVKDINYMSVQTIATKYKLTNIFDIFIPFTYLIEIKV